MVKELNDKIKKEIGQALIEKISLECNQPKKIRLILDSSNDLIRGVHDIFQRIPSQTVKLSRQTSPL